MQLDLSPVSFSRHDIMRELRVPNELTTDLAEDVGYHIGDGYMKSYSDKWSIKYDFCYTGHVLEDNDYIFNIFLPRKKALFNLKVCRIKKYNQNSISAWFKSKALFTFYRDVLKVQESPKINISVPKWVYSNKRFEAAFLRGLFDSDGCLSFLKKYKTINYYPVISFSTVSEALFKDVKNILSDLNIKHIGIKVIRGDKQYTNRVFTRYDININGIERLYDWMNKVGFKNIKHLSKYLVWKKLGYCTPNSTVDARRLILSGPSRI